MKKFLKYLISLFFIIFLFTGVFAKTWNYLYYYGETCSSCIQLWEFFKKNDIYEKYNITKKEVFYNEKNRKELLEKWEKMWYNLQDIKVPFFIDINNNIAYNKSSDIVNIFHDNYTNQFDENNDGNCDINWTTCTIEELNKNKEKSSMNFLLVLIPAALADSINPCAFAILFLILWTILSRTKSKKKVIISWISFSLAIFIAYFLLWVWVYKLLWLTNFSQHVGIFKIVVWIIGILIWLFNIKDYFFYGKWFVMEVPFAWRNNMRKIVKKATSPVWAFIVWIIVSLFLLPCTSWPYLTVLWYLWADSTLKMIVWYWYLILYNLIFILPMLVLTFIVWFGLKNIDELKEIREFNVEKIHLIVWILMLLIGIYIIWEVLFL